MVGLDHGSHSPGEDDHPETAARNSRVGLAFFFVYVLLYGGFVACAVLGWLNQPLGGTNLAVWYGFGLIAAAFAMSLAYGAICRGEARSATKGGKGE